jgi:hypothetical protein
MNRASSSNQPTAQQVLSAQVLSAMCVHFFRRCRTLFFCIECSPKQSRVGLFDVNRATWKLANCSSSECAFLTIFNSRSLVFSLVFIIEGLTRFPQIVNRSSVVTE